MISWCFSVVPLESLKSLNKTFVASEHWIQEQYSTYQYSAYSGTKLQTHYQIRTSLLQSNKLVSSHSQWHPSTCITHAKHQCVGWHCDISIFKNIHLLPPHENGENSFKISPLCYFHVDVWPKKQSVNNNSYTCGWGLRCIMAHHPTKSFFSSSTKMHRCNQ